MKRKRASAGAPGAAPFDFVGMSCPCCYRPGGARSLFCGERACAPDDAPKKLAGLRALMRECGVAAYVVPSEDAHASEYVAAADERLSWLTGFTGSAGDMMADRVPAMSTCGTSTTGWLTTGEHYSLAANEEDTDATVCLTAPSCMVTFLPRMEWMRESGGMLGRTARSASHTFGNLSPNFARDPLHTCVL